MTERFLDIIVGKTREKVGRIKAAGYSEAVKRRAEKIRDMAIPGRFFEALASSERANIIAEIKRASPSKGVIKSDIRVDRIAQEYESCGAAAISVLTESEYFLGEIADLVLAARSVDLPILRKDFTVDAYQIYEAAAAGADAVLLIAAALSPNEIREFSQITHGLGMNAVVEVHTADEFAFANEIGAKIIGINNRDLNSLEVSLDVSRELIKGRTGDALLISESGITNRSEIDELRGLGFDGFLIGETLMRDINSLGGLLA